jgi:hypothetical protein
MLNRIFFKFFSCIHNKFIKKAIYRREVPKYCANKKKRQKGG